MGERILLNNTTMPGWSTASTPTMGSEQRRVEVFDPAGMYAGTVVYVRRKSKNGTVYGWRPEQQPRVLLTDKLDAVRRLPRVAKEQT